MSDTKETLAGSKYGWEIADEVQRYVGNSADMEFVSAAAYFAVCEERDDWRQAARAEADMCDQLQANLAIAREALAKLVDLAKIAGTWGPSEYMIDPSSASMFGKVAAQAREALKQIENN